MCEGGRAGCVCWWGVHACVCVHVCGYVELWVCLVYMGGYSIVNIGIY